MLEKLVFGMLYLTGGLLGLRGILLFYRAIKNRQFDLALLMFGIFLMVATAVLPLNETWKNYFYIGFGVCFVIFYIVFMFGDFILHGSLKDRLFIFFGILSLVLILLFGSKIHLPDWFGYIPTI